MHWLVLVLLIVQRALQKGHIHTIHIALASYKLQAKRLPFITISINQKKT